jgi:hypothetical protein
VFLFFYDFSKPYLRNYGHITDTALFWTVWNSYIQLKDPFGIFINYYFLDHRHLEDLMNQFLKKKYSRIVNALQVLAEKSSERASEYLHETV